MALILYDEKSLKELHQSLAFNYQEYLRYLDDEIHSVWCGVSFQRTERVDLLKEDLIENIISDYVELLKNTFKQFDSETNKWIMQHEYRSFAWFPQDRLEEPKLKKLHQFFTSNKIPFDFKGGFQCDGSQIVDISRELIRYPFTINYKNIDLINLKKSLVIKFTHHLTIDFISNSVEFLHSLIEKIPTKEFDMKEYG